MKKPAPTLTLVVTEHDHVEPSDLAASVTAHALNEIDGELEAVSTALASLRSREMLLRAARDEVLHRSRAAEAVAQCLEASYLSMPTEFDEDNDSYSPLHIAIQEQFDHHVEGILSVAERVGA